MTQSILFASNNAHKAKELKVLLPGFDILSYKDVFKKDFKADETGLSFHQNALIKLEAIENHPQLICLAEDSGLVVEALDGEPGIYSARYGKTHFNDEDRARFVLEKMTEKAHRAAHYISIIAIRMPTHTVHLVQGRVDGHIAKTYEGTNGFGYDPIFIPNGYTDTFGILDPSVKEKLSHRARACTQLLSVLERDL